MQATRAVANALFAPITAQAVLSTGTIGFGDPWVPRLLYGMPDHHRRRRFSGFLRTADRQSLHVLDVAAADPGADDATRAGRRLGARS